MKPLFILTVIGFCAGAQLALTYYLVRYAVKKGILDAMRERDVEKGEHLKPI